MYHHFLGFKFLVRNEEKNEIPCQGTRKIQGKFKKFVRLHFYQFYLVYTDTQNFWVLTRTRTVSLFLECF